MSEANPQASANPSFFAPQELFSQMQQFAAPFAAAATEQVDRFVAASEQIASWQREGMQRVEAATDEMGKLFKRGLQYSAELADQARTASVEATRRAMDLVTPRA